MEENCEKEKEYLTLDEIHYGQEYVRENKTNLPYDTCDTNTYIKLIYPETGRELLLDIHKPYVEPEAIHYTIWIRQPGRNSWSSLGGVTKRGEEIYDFTPTYYSERR
jgi:hypothetical protein